MTNDNKYAGVNGIIYLVHPGDLLDMNVLKIGLSYKQHINRVRTGYNQNTIWVSIKEVEDVFNVERIIKNVFRKKFGKPYKGNEYFQGDLKQIRKIFHAITEPFVLESKNNILKNPENVEIENSEIESNETESYENENNESENNEIDIKNTKSYFQCDICGYKTKYKCNYNKHRLNKNSCKKKVSCLFCEKNFQRDKSLKNHLKTCWFRTQKKCKFCKKKFARIYNLKEHLNKCKSRQSNELFKCYICKQEFNDKKSVIQHMTSCLLKSGLTSASSQTITNNTVNNVVNQTNNTNIILNFGNEHLSYLTADNLKKCYIDPKNAISNLVKMIHYNQQFPENSNIRISDPNSKYIQFYDGNGWNYELVKSALRKIADKNLFLLKKNLDICDNVLSPEEKTHFDNYYMEYLEPDKDVIESAKDKIMILVVKNSKNLIFNNTSP